MLFWFLLGKCYDEVYFSSDDFNLGYAWSRLKQLEFWVVTASVVFKGAKKKKQKQAQLESTSYHPAMEKKKSSCPHCGKFELKASNSIIFGGVIKGIKGLGKEHYTS